MKEIYLVRHGQTGYNLKGIVQGRGIDTSLNETGKEQAAAFYKYYKHIPFKKIYISSLRRTHQSVDLFIKDGIPFEALPGLDEISWGISEGLEHSANNNTRYYHTISQWSQGKIDVRIEDGESPLDVKRRQQEAFNYILSQKDEDVVLVCMHGRAMRILLSWLTDNHLKDMDTFDHDNLCLYKLSYAENRFSIDLYNDRRHLHHLNGNGKAKL